MKSLFKLCLNAIGSNLDEALMPWVNGTLPVACKEQLLEWLVSHDQISRCIRLSRNRSYVHCNCSIACRHLLRDAHFTRNITRISFYLSDFIDDSSMSLLAQHHLCLHKLTLIYCSQLTDVGVAAITKGALHLLCEGSLALSDQYRLTMLELRGLKTLTYEGLRNVDSPLLQTVDLSECVRIDTRAVVLLLAA